jgi:hypothetical protein
MSLRLRYVQECVGPERVDLLDRDGQRGDLGADEVVGAVASSVAVGLDIGNAHLAGEGGSLVVDGETVVGSRALEEAEAVETVAAGDDLGRQAGYFADLAGEVCGVLAEEGEAGALDGAVGLAKGECADGDKLSVSGLRSRGSDRGGGEERGDGEELHVVWFVVGSWLMGRC